MTRTLRAALASAGVPGWLRRPQPHRASRTSPISRGSAIGYGLVVDLNGTGPARYDCNPAWWIKVAGAIQADIKPVADPMAKARAGHRLRGNVERMRCDFDNTHDPRRAKVGTHNHRPWSKLLRGRLQARAGRNSCAPPPP
jgi:hypothetical protein